MTQPPMMPPPPPPGMPYQPQPQPRAGNGLAVASLICGIVSLVLFCVWFVSVPLGIFAIVLGVIASGKISRGEATGGGMAKTGLILGIVGIVLSLAAVLAFLAGYSFLGTKAKQLQQRIEEEQRKQEQQQQPQSQPTTEPSTRLERPNQWRLAALDAEARTVRFA